MLSGYHAAVWAFRLRRSASSRRCAATNPITDLIATGAALKLRLEVVRLDSTGVVTAAVALATGRSSLGGFTVISAFVVAAVAAIVFSLVLQVWMASVQIRRFLHWFSGTPDGDEKVGRLFDVYGWRARLAVRLFRIQLPPGFAQGPKSSSPCPPPGPKRAGGYY